MIEIGKEWFARNGWTPFAFQIEAWEAYLGGKSGLVNAPTGSGKTYSLLVPILLEYLRDHPKKPKNSGLRAIWITPIRALSKEIELAANRAIEALDIPWKVGVRSGDTSLAKRQRQRDRPPELLITTPESLHLLMASKGYAEYFASLQSIVVDEWHELMGSKRGVQMELALSRLKKVAPGLKVWGISATIGNMEQAMEVLLGDYYRMKNTTIIRSNIKKKTEIISIFPDEVERIAVGRTFRNSIALESSSYCGEEPEHAHLHQHEIVRRDMVSEDARHSTRAEWTDRHAPRIDQSAIATMGRRTAS